MDELFYDPAGLQQAALLVEAEFKRGIDQKTLAQKAGVAASTIGALRLNIHNSGDRIVRWINPSILLKLGPHITNPETQQPFSAEEFLEIARGQRKVSPEGRPTPSLDTPRSKETGILKSSRKGFLKAKSKRPY